MSTDQGYSISKVTWKTFSSVGVEVPEKKNFLKTTQVLPMVTLVQSPNLRMLLSDSQTSKIEHIKNSLWKKYAT